MTKEIATHTAQPPLFALIERVVSNPDADINKLEKLLDMQERVMLVNREQAFNAAMADMQQDIPTIEKNGSIAVDGKVRSKYARYEDIMRAMKPVLQKYGFAVSFRTETGKDFVKVTGILMHRDGHREQTEMMLPLDVSGSKNVVQAIGSSTSYGKRYVLCSLLNIATGDEDDDARSISADAEQQKFAAWQKKVDAIETIEAYNAARRATLAQFEGNVPRKIARMFSARRMELEA